ncbi:hypothetical protein HID58_046499, partial [Brassica napus]
QAEDYKTHAPEVYTLGSLNIAPPNIKCYPCRPKKIRILSNCEFKFLTLIYLFMHQGVIGHKARTCRKCGGTDHIR